MKMALIGQTLPSLLDIYNRTDKNGRIARIVEQLAKTNDILTDAIYVPCNDGSSTKPPSALVFLSRCGAAITRACSQPKPRPYR
jgi:hypothetical protein